MYKKMIRRRREEWEEGKNRREKKQHVIFFFNDTATTEIYTLSLHDALPIWTVAWKNRDRRQGAGHP